MADSVKFTIGGQLAPSYRGALSQAASLALSENEKLNRQIAAQQGYGNVPRSGQSTVMMAQLRERYFPSFLTRLAAPAGAAAGAAAGGSFMARFFGSLSKFGGHESRMGMMQFIHSIRATFDALVAGINPWRVFLYEGPQALQALTLMGGGFIRMLLTLTGILGAVAAAGYAVYRAFRYVREGWNFKRALDDTLPSLVQHIDAQREVAEAMRQHAEMVDELSRRHRTLGDVLDQQNRKLRDRQQLELELARAQGRSARELTAITIKQEQEMVKKLHADEQALRLQKARDQAASDAAAAAVGDEGRLAQLAKDKAQAEDFKQRIAEAEASLNTSDGLARYRKLREEKGGNFLVKNYKVIPQQFGAPISVDATLDQIIAGIEGGGVNTKGTGGPMHASLKELTAAYAKFQSDLDNLTAKQHDLNKINEERAKGLQVTAEQYEKAHKAFEEAYDKLELDRQFLPKITEASRSPMELTASQKTGAFAYGAQLSVAQQQLSVAQQHLAVSTKTNELNKLMLTTLLGKQLYDPLGAINGPFE